MVDMRDLWWAAGRLATLMPADDWRSPRWNPAVRRSATLIEPAWPQEEINGPFIQALPTAAFVLYAGPRPIDPESVPVEELIASLTPGTADSGERTVDDVVREGLLGLGHDLRDDSQMSVLFGKLTTSREPPAESGSGLTAVDNRTGSSLMGESAKWAAYWFKHHHLDEGSTP
ncbi:MULTISPECIES: hypothetical protein [unclassified Streptomyces]|uniref:hypothetical protein n=1 Tax=unclassified Streptomyces TaxID=2593676 RepID=UPI002DD8EEF5|nr:hypothetical protein [Streptomyces sp. NBC_01445]WSE11427.1 hypothetical protein OG574_50430 [Streptomyces sp. NBC_01445]